MAGLVMIDRDLLSHPVVGISNPKRMAAWLWMICQARWKDGQANVNGRTMDLARGQFASSIRRMADETGLSVKEVRSLMARLERDNMVQKTGTLSGTGGGTGVTIITICNYDKYQCFDEYRAQGEAQQRAQKGHSKGTARAQERTPEETPDETPEGTPEKECGDLLGEKIAPKIDKSGEAFDRFYAAYPVKKGKAKAKLKFAKAVRDGVDPERIIAAAAIYAKTPDVARGFGQWPQTWLHGGHWDDADLQPPPTIRAETPEERRRRMSPQWGEVVR